MVRNTRTLNRIFFALVLAGGLVGAVFAAAFWQVDATALAVPGLDPAADWVDTISLLSEELIQFFLGWTN